MTTPSRQMTRRSMLFWLGCALIALGVSLHLPMLAQAHRMGNRLVGMPVDATMVIGMAAIAIGAVLATFGALPPRRATIGDHRSFEAPDDMPLNRHHAAVLAVLVVGLVIDTMKPATLGFVLPGLAREYGIAKSTAALLPLVALTGTTIGSFVWGWMADAYGRRTAILLSTILFVATSVCGAMPRFEWNLVMCFLMGSSAGGMLPVVYALLAEVMPPRHRSWVLVLVGGVGLVGGFLAASASAHAFEPDFGWRSLWLQGFPTGLLLLAMARWIPDSPRFLAAQGRTEELATMERKFGLRQRRVAAAAADGESHRGLTVALVLTALAWSVVNFGLLLWLPSDLQDRGMSAAIASGVIARSALLALPTIALGAWLYAKWSSKKTLVLAVLLTLAGLGSALLPADLLKVEPLLVAVVALLVVGANGTIALLLPYTAENYPLGVRGRMAGLVAGSSKVGGVAVQGLALAGLVPTLVGTAAVLVVPMAMAAALIARSGRETHGLSLGALEAA